MSYETDEEVVIEEDFYTFLNISKEASRDEINAAYRRLSKLYHPDKHLEPEQKEKAELLFNKTKRAYEVLSDPHQRAIYDSLGVKGLETEGWEVVQRTRTPAEIRAEYDKIAEEAAQRQKEQRTNPHGSVTVSINATDLFNPYIDELLDEMDSDSSAFPSVEISGMNFSQSVEFPLTQKDTCTLSGQLHTQNGNGGGGVNLNWRHLYSHKSWSELEVAAGNGPAISLKAFRTLNKRFFWNGGAMLQFMPMGVMPGIVSSVGLQFDKHTVGYLNYSGGIRSLLSTNIVRDTEYGTSTLNVQFGLPHSFVSLSLVKKLFENEIKIKVAIKAGTFGGIFEYGIDKKVSKHSRVAASVAIGMPTGVKLKVRLTRANQIYSFPIHLCEEIMPAPIFYATIIPLIVYVVVKKGFVDPFLREEHVRHVERQRESNRTVLLRKRQEAQAATDLMTTTYARICEEEEQRKGLVIVKAMYGKIVNESGDPTTDDDLLDVTVSLQCLVKDSKLILHEMSKSQLPGFFDIAVGESKSLVIKYNYRQQLHEITIRDDEGLRIPKTSHKITSAT